MKSRPILMSAPMVRALLDGRKTQTRRILKNPEYYGCPTGDCPHDTQEQCNHAMQQIADHLSDEGSDCPYGIPGDFLWVRECFSYCALDAYKGNGRPWYWADGNPDDGDYGKPKPSIHMPRWASRLTLEITNIRVERVQDISEEDAKEEGCFFKDYGRRCFHQAGDTAFCPAPDEHHPQKEGWMWKETTSNEQCLYTAKSAYGNLWNTIHGAESWYANPWVWAISFKVHQQNVNSLLKTMAA